MGMKSWEREIIEYRPRIGLDPSIHSLIVKEIEETGRTYQPTSTILQAMDVLGVDFLEKGISLLSEIHAQRKEIEKELGHDSLFIQFKELKEKNDSEFHQVYLDNLQDINGSPSIDIYPIILELEEELETYLDYINEELYEGHADFNNLDQIREEEESMIESLLRLESEDLSRQQQMVWTEDQKKLIDKMIADPNYPIQSYQDYEKLWLEERLSLGSPRIDYAMIQDRSAFLLSVSEKLKGIDTRFDLATRYLKADLNPYLNNDIQGSLEYLVDYSNFSLMKEAIELSFSRHSSEAWNQYMNQVRVSDLKLRQYLDQKVSEIRRKKRSLVDSLGASYKESIFNGDGARGIQHTIEEGIVAADIMWKQVLAEHIATSHQVVDQQARFLEKLQHKRKNQLIYQYIDLVQREFDFREEDRQKEIHRFLESHNLL